MAEKQIMSIKPQHEAIADWLISNPGGKQKDLAVDLGFAESTVSIVLNSDIFKEYWERRIIAHQKAVSESVIEKTEKVAGAVLDEIHERITGEKAEPIPLSLLNDVAGTSLKALGFGRDRGRGGNINIVIGVPPEDLERAREKMRGRAADNARDVTPVESGGSEVIEAEATAAIKVSAA